MIVPERLCSGVSELPASAPVGVRAPGTENGERVPTADVGVPINRAGVTEGAAATWVVAWAIAATGMVATITAPTVPARPSSASRRVMSASGPGSGCCGSAGSNRVDNCVTSKGNICVTRGGICCTSCRGPGSGNLKFTVEFVGCPAGLEPTVK